MNEATGPWFTAIENGSISQVRDLMDTNCGKTSTHGETGLMRAVRCGHLDIVRLLAEKEAGSISTNGLSALAIAAALNSVPMCEVLTQLEAELKLPGNTTPLIIAAKYGAINALKALIPHSNVSLADDNNMTALDYAAQRNFAKCTFALLESNRFSAADIGKALLYTGAGEYSETIRLITNALCMKYSKSSKDSEISEISNNFLKQAAKIIELQSENKALKAATDWLHAHNTQHRSNPSDTKDIIYELKNQILAFDNKIRSLKARIAQAQEEFLVLQPQSGFDFYEVDMSAVRVREAELRKLQASISKASADLTSFANVDLLDDSRDYYIKKSTKTNAVDKHLTDIEESLSDISIHESRVLLPIRASNEGHRSTESNSIIEFLEGIQDGSAQKQVRSSSSVSPLYTVCHHKKPPQSINGYMIESSSEDHSSSTTKLKVLDESDIGILQKEVIDLRSIIGKYENDKLTHSFVGEPNNFNMFSSLMFGDLRPSQTTEFLRKPPSPKNSKAFSQSFHYVPDKSKQKLSISVLSSVAYDPDMTENVISHTLENMESGSFTDLLAREHTSVSASALKSKIEHLKQKMQLTKKLPRPTTAANNKVETRISKGVQTITVRCDSTSNNLLNDFVALDKYKQAFYETTLTNMESYLIAVELKMKSIVKMARHIFNPTESSMSDGHSLSCDRVTIPNNFLDGNLEGDVMHHIDTLQELMRFERNRFSSISHASSPHTRSSDHSLVIESPIEFGRQHDRDRSGCAAVNNQADDGSKALHFLPRAPSSNALKAQEDSHSEETGDEIVPSFEAFSGTQSIRSSQHSEHASVSLSNDALANELKEKTAEIILLTQRLAEHEELILQLSTDENCIYSRLEQKMQALRDELQKHKAENSALKAQLSACDELRGLLRISEYKMSAYEYLIYVLLPDSLAVADAFLTFNENLNAKSPSPAEIEELKALLNAQAQISLGHCSDTLRTSLQPLLDLLTIPAPQNEIQSNIVENNLSNLQLLAAPDFSGILSQSSNPSLEKVIKEEFKVFFQPNHDNNTPLMNAVLAKNIIAVRSLLHYARQLNNKGETALMLAITTHNEEIIRTLLGLEAGHICSNGDCALLRCLTLDELTFANLLTSVEGIDPTEYLITHKDKSKKPPEILNAAADGDIVKVWSLLRHQKRATDATGKTSLMLAAEAGYLRIVEILCEHEHQMRDSLGRTALMFACSNNQRDTALALVAHEAGMQNTEGKTALMYAAANDNLDSIRALISYESGKTALKEDGTGPGYTALMIAANKGHIDSVRLLASHEKNIKDSKGRRAIDYTKNPAIKAEILAAN